MADAIVAQDVYFESSRAARFAEPVAEHPRLGLPASPGTKETALVPLPATCESVARPMAPATLPRYACCA
jgi:hypothetical protein